MCSRTDACHVDRALRALAAATRRGIVEPLARGEATKAELATCIENITPGEPFSKGLAAIPTSPENAVHWIIAVLGTGPIGEGSDGVVEYASAHIEGVESELILPNTPNTIPGRTDAIEEVRQILPLHIGVERRGRCSKQDRR